MFLSFVCSCTNLHTCKLCQGAALATQGSASGTASAMRNFYLGRPRLSMLDTAALLACNKRQEPALNAEAITNRVNVVACPSASQNLIGAF